MLLGTPYRLVTQARRGRERRGLGGRARRARAQASRSRSSRPSTPRRRHASSASAARRAPWRSCRTRTSCASTTSASSLDGRVVPRDGAARGRDARRDARSAGRCRLARGRPRRASRPRRRSRPRTRRASCTATSSRRTCSLTTTRRGQAARLRRRHGADRGLRPEADGARSARCAASPSSARPSTWRPSRSRATPVDGRTDVYALGLRALRDADRRARVRGPVERRRDGQAAARHAAAPRVQRRRPQHPARRSTLW